MTEPLIASGPDDPGQADHHTLVTAVRAVLAIHVPSVPPSGMAWVSGGTDPICLGCSDGDPFTASGWPCLTVQAITTALGTPSRKDTQQ